MVGNAVNFLKTFLSALLSHLDVLLSPKVVLPLNCLHGTFHLSSPSRSLSVFLCIPISLCPLHVKLVM